MIDISVVIPVYRGQDSLPILIEELRPFTDKTACEKNSSGFFINEVILVHDCGPDNSDAVLQNLEAQFCFIRSIWLSNNFGQHAATLAGISSSMSSWVVTMDEDGQQNPEDIEHLLNVAQEKNSQVVYASPKTSLPHSFFRNLTSVWAKKLAGKLVGNPNLKYFNSFRLINGELARTLAAYVNQNTYLDVALCWMAKNIDICKVELRAENRVGSGYSLKSLFKHFWQLILTSGTRPLRVITMLGFSSVFIATGLAVYAVINKFTVDNLADGWASMVTVFAFFSGVILVSLGLIAEYLSVAVSIAMGKPLYVITSKPTRPSKK